MKTRILVMSGILVIVSAAAFGQVSSMTSSSSPNGQFSMTVGFNAPRHSMPVVAGAPYSGEQISERAQTLVDGTHITEEPRSQFHVYRDSAGRTRMERSYVMRQQAQPDAPIIIEINDPVEGCQYILDTVNQVAHRSTFQTPPQGSSTLAAGGAFGGGVSAGEMVFSAPASGVPLPGPGPTVAAGVRGPLSAAGVRPEFSTESLGTKVIEGVLSEGKRTSAVYAAGTVGNDRPFTTTMEIWTSPDLKVMILARNYDPRSGESVTRLTNLSRAEPDPGLFRVPAGYRIVDETGPFTIKISRP